MQAGSARVAVSLAAAIAAMWLPGRAIASPDKGGKVNLSQALKKTLLLFPFDVPSTSAANAAEVSSLLTDVASSRLIASGAFAVTAYFKALPNVARLHNDQQLTDTDVTPPFADDNRKPIKVGKLAGYDTVFVGSVDDYQYDQAKNQVTMTVSGRMLEVETGKVMKSVTLSGSSGTGGNAKEDEKAIEAARASGDKLMTQLVPAVATNALPPPDTRQQPVAAKKKRSNDWVWGLLAIGLGLGIGLSGGGGGGGGGSDNPPAPPGH